MSFPQNTEVSNTAPVYAENGWGFVDHIYQDITAEFGMVHAVLLFILAILLWIIYKQVEARLKDRQSEIDRMALDLKDLRSKNLELTNRLIQTKD